MLTIPMNGPWLFRKLPGAALDNLPGAIPDGTAETVTLPHTWYSDEDQYRGLALYETVVPRNPAWQEVLLSFDGADQNCRVFVNGLEAGGHAGAYARFRLQVPEAAMRADSLEIRVFLENRQNEDLSPCFGDFTVFGGLYRGAELLVTGRNRFDRCFYGTDGLIVRTETDAAGNGVLTAEPHTVCSAGNAKILYRLADEEGRVLQTAEGRPDETVSFAVKSARLWDGPGNAHFYFITAALEADGKAEDEVTIRTGFRRVEISGEGGLTLNGRPHMLRGVAKHQDRAGKFSAVSDEDIREDFALIREIGANAVRLSHYQHPQRAYDCCDENGLLCWAEIPMLKMTESAALMQNAEQQLAELILQNIHHPSVFCWGIQNEIAMFRDAPFMHENCRKLHGLVKALDPARFSACANLYPLKAGSRLNEITDLVGYNVYFGWYYGEAGDYGAWLDRFHEARPALPLGISEYGVDANLKLHAEEPALKDYSEEYQALWHETVYPQIESRPWMWGSFVWNMFDFSSARRNEGGRRFVNAKGLVSHDRKIRKDAFFYYKARWSAEPFLHLCAKRFEKRAAERTDVRCYTSLPEAELEVNGQILGRAAAANGTALFRDVPLREGKNEIRVRSGEYSDSCVWEKVSEPEPSYRLPEEPGGGPVRNWFLADDDIRREGYFSIEDTANDLLENPDARKILEAYIPGLVKVMTEQNVIPLGLTLKSILSHDPDESLDAAELNKELNQIPNE